MKARILTTILLIVSLLSSQACADLLVFKDKSTAQATVLEFYDGKFKIRLEGEIAIKLYDAKDFYGIYFIAEAPKATPVAEDVPTPLAEEEEIQKPKRGKLRITNSRWYSKRKYTYIVGEVKNKGDTVLERVKVTASIYDKKGNLVDTDYCYVDSIEPGEEEPFEMMIETQEGKFHRFKLKAKSRN